MQKKLLIFLMLIGNLANAQGNKNIKIDTAGVVNIYGKGNVIIGKAIIQQTLKTKTLLLSSTQEIDSSGIYTTVLNFGNASDIPLFGVNLSFSFSEPVIWAEGGGSGMGITWGFSENHKNYYYRASQINLSPFGDIMMQFIIKSKTKILITINGIDGVVK